MQSVRASPFSFLGSGRGGSAWVEMVLQQHPRIAQANEAGALGVRDASAYPATLPRPQVGTL